MSDKHIQWQPSNISKKDRHLLNSHKSCVLWLTGLSGSGKSTLAYEMDRLLYNQNVRSYVLDGDNLRHGLNGNLGFSPEDRSENIRRTAEAAKLLVDAGMIAIVALISPYRADREQARSLFSEGEFIEVYVDCPLHICEERDPKGLYMKARAGVIPNFTGITAPYEQPFSPEIVISSNRQSLQASASRIYDYLLVHQIIENHIPGISIE
ncbi:adenylyl-sulfate kinase [Paenibacillus planticolens]|uniref:Adenylyl-sulfate kinase n=1 Tax=Paenibacillus planticolens TaxID=2654976 RepID=A0ABX1ZW29_9BACL|nr:adenylyl-sulfate kinase [Paenibacillus planticolens]NOV04254.1 adenylyl-sulfate kinase [Paenibacillus planticolens]